MTSVPALDRTRGFKFDKNPFSLRESLPGPVLPSPISDGATAKGVITERRYELTSLGAREAAERLIMQRVESGHGKIG